MSENLSELVDQIRQASGAIERCDARTNKRLDGIEKSINELYLKHNGPGGWETKDDDVFERKDAIGLCRNRRNLTIPKVDTGVPDPDDYTPTPTDEAMLRRKAMKALFRHGDVGRLDHLEKKA